jgi:hypothetical protein
MTNGSLLPQQQHRRELSQLLGQQAHLRFQDSQLLVQVGF